MSSIVVGVSMPLKKRTEMNFGRFLEHAATLGFEVKLIDLDADLEAQGPFDVILHKVLYDMVKVDVDADSARRVAAFRALCDAHPDLVVLDPVDNIAHLMSRQDTYRWLDGLTVEGLDVRCPRHHTFEELPGAGEVDARLGELGLAFPLICKTVQACGTSASHEMGIVFNEAMLRTFDAPLLVQRYVNHDATIHKVYAVEDKVHVSVRPSKRNVSADETDVIRFNSQVKDVAADDFSPVPLADGVAERIARALKDKLGLSLFGFDVIRECGTDTLFMFDVNYFPGYGGVPDFWRQVAELMARRMAGRARASATW